MSQPVKISDELLIEARTAGEAMQRSIAGQVEFWARLGMSVEGLLTGQQMRVIGCAASSDAVLKRLDTVDSPEGRKRVKDYLASQPYPHYHAHAQEGRLVREDEDGRRTVGRFVNREFVAVKQNRKAAVA